MLPMLPIFNLLADFFLLIFTYLPFKSVRKHVSDLYSATYNKYVQRLLTGMIKHNYKNKLLTKQSDQIEIFCAVFFLKKRLIQSS